MENRDRGWPSHLYQYILNMIRSNKFQSLRVLRLYCISMQFETQACVCVCVCVLYALNTIFRWILQILSPEKRFLFSLTRRERLEP